MTTTPKPWSLLKAFISICCLAALFAPKPGLGAQAKPAESLNLPQKSANLEIAGLQNKLNDLRQRLMQQKPGTPKAAEAALPLGILCVLAGDFEAGQGYLHQAGTGMPALEPYASYYLGLASFKKSDLPAASREFERCAADSSALKPDALYMLALCKEGLGDQAGALAKYESWLNSNGQLMRGVVLLRAANLAVALGRYEKAEAYLRELCQEYPQAVSADKAEALAERLNAEGRISYAPKSPANLLARAQTLIDKNQTAKGLGLLEMLGPNASASERSRALYLTGKAHYAKRATSQAMLSFEQAESLDPSGEIAAYALLHQARCLWRSDSPEDAELMRQKLREVIRKYPQNAKACEQARRYLLLLASERGEFSQAIAAAKDILKSDPKGEFAEQARWLSALSSFALSDQAAARDGLKEYLNLYKGGENEAAAYYWLGKCELALKSPKDAALAFKNAAAKAANSYYGHKSEEALQGLGASANGQASELALSEVVCPGSSRLAGEPLPAASRNASERARVLAAGYLGELAERELALEIAQNPSPELNLQYARLATSLGKHTAAVGALWKVFGSCLQRGSASDLASIREMVYPRKYAELVNAQMAGSGIDPGVIFGLIRQESFFEENAVSGAGAIGLMQMMPATARVLAKEIGETRFTAEDLRDPAVNIRFGTAYFKQKLSKFGNLSYTLCSYNAGEKKLKVWIERLGNLDPDLFVEFIPYSETRDYVRRILGNQVMYAKLYP